MNIKNNSIWIFIVLFVIFFVLCLSGNLVFSPSSEASVGSTLVIGESSSGETPSGGSSGGSIIYDCDDGIDNDEDGLIDFPLDPGCSDENDNSEVDPVIPGVISCEDECNPGDLVCSDDVVYKRCGYYDSDNCLDWSEDLGCDEGYVCQDDEGCLLIDEPGEIGVKGFNYCSITWILLLAIIVLYIVNNYGSKKR